DEFGQKPPFIGVEVGGLIARGGRIGGGVGRGGPGDLLSNHVNGKRRGECMSQERPARKRDLDRRHGSAPPWLGTPGRRAGGAMSSPAGVSRASRPHPMTPPGSFPWPGTVAYRLLLRDRGEGAFGLSRHGEA